MRVFSFGKLVPLSWWIPQKERAILAAASTLFWFSSIVQALHEDTHGASVFAFYGLGLLYVVCGMANVAGGVRKTLTRRYRRHDNKEQPRALLQLFVILASMLFFNTVVLIIYLQRGATVTPIDVLSCILAVTICMVLLFRYSFKGLFSHPYARGCLALVFKALPQGLLAGLFILNPPVAQGFTIWSLGTLTILAALRFWPSVLAYRRERRSQHMQGLLLGECGNMLTIILMVVSWGYCQLFIGYS